MVKKAAIITGAGQGIGYEVALQLGREGYNLLINDLDSGLLLGLTEQLRSMGCTAKALAGNCSQLPVLQQLVTDCLSHFGTITTVVANAGITTFGQFLDYEPASLQELYQTNIFGTFFLVQTAAKVMIQQNTNGSIIIMSSVTAHTAHENLVAYGMTKAALEHLAKCLTVELGPKGIRVNCVAPGITATERTLQDSQYMAAWLKINPLPKVASVQDIAQAVAFLADGQRSGHMTGQTLLIDGGWSSVAASPYKT
jgi:glucose 1-dehydrogenase